MLSIITTFSLDYVLIPLGEHWCWSLFGLKARTYSLSTDEPKSPNSFPVMAWIALFSSCLLSINKTNQFLISIADVWKNKTWLYHSHVCYTEQNFPTFHLLTDDISSPPAPLPPPLSRFHQLLYEPWVFFQFSLIFVVFCERRINGFFFYGINYRMLW